MLAQSMRRTPKPPRRAVKCSVFSVRLFGARALPREPQSISVKFAVAVCVCACVHVRACFVFTTCERILGPNSLPEQKMPTPAVASSGSTGGSGATGALQFCDANATGTAPTDIYVFSMPPSLLC